MAEHRFHFFRAGGVDQVSLRDGKDLVALKDLDNKLWVALAMPVAGVDIDPETLALLDEDKDGRVRKDDVVAAIAWIAKTFKDPGDVLKSATAVKLTQLADDKVVAAAKRMLADLGKKDATSIAVEDMAAVAKAFADTALNGDGVITSATTADAELQRVIADGVATHGAVTDRSGKPGIDKAVADAMFADAEALVAWRKAESRPYPEAPAGADALAAVKAKLEDYFTRAGVAAFDARGGAALAGSDAEIAALSARALSAGDEELAKLPLAHVTRDARLALAGGLNPAWAARIKTFVDAAVTPIVGAREALTPADLGAVVDKLAPFETWRAAKPATKLAALDPAWVEKLAEPALRERVHKLIADDAALAPEYDAIALVGKAVRFQRDFGRVVRNFANFSDFYSRQDGAFQCGILYLDARALELAVPVIDAAKHAALAASSDAYLLYLDCTRLGEKQQIVVAVTNGDADNLFVGRNGVYYDRKGQDWDATIAKVLASPISIREAFFSPYKKLVKVIEETVSKRASEAEGKSMAAMEETGKGVGEADKTATATPPPATVEAPKKIDLGTIAAIGVAVGGVGTLVGALLGAMFGLGAWLPLGLIALILMISAPSMLLAWLKLRRRNLGPILDANGWAVNGRARINVAFGAALTKLAKLPVGSSRSMDDPFADKKTKWKRWVMLVVLVVLAGTWYVGKLDQWIPWDRLTSRSVLGESAPVVKREKEAALAQKAADDAKAAADAKKPGAPAAAPAAGSAAGSGSGK